MTTTDAATALGLSRSRIIQLINEGKLPAERFGSSWMIQATHLSKVKVYGKSGRPPKPR